MSLISAKRSKTGAATWLTRAANVCAELSKGVTIDEVDFEDAMVNYERRLSVWDEAEVLYESLVDQDNLENEIEEAGNYRDKCEAFKRDLIKARARIHPVSALPGSSSDASVESRDSKRSVRLPTLDLPKFDGDVLKFMPFWQQFEACVDQQNDFPEVSKFNYLVGLLKGDARSAVEGIPITAENYGEAKTIVLKRFGRKELIIFSHVQALLNLNIPETTQLMPLSQFRDKLTAHVRSLAALEIKSDNFGVILTPIIVSRLPEEIRLEWSRESEGKEADLGFLMEFLEKEINRRERCKSFGSFVTQSKFQGQQGSDFRRKENVRHSSAAALQSGSSFVRKCCDFCGKPHETHKCFKFLNLGVTDRQRKVDACKLCFKCLGQGHMARDCDAMCRVCKCAHHESLCYKQPGNADAVTHKEFEDRGATGGTAALAVHKSHGESFLPTATVKVRGPDNKWIVATLLFDSGSDKSYVSSAFVKKSSPKWIKHTETRFASFGGSSHQSRSNVFEFCVKGVNREAVFQATEVPVICLPLSRPRVDSRLLERFAHLNLANNFNGDSGSLSIDILIGQDLFWSLMLGHVFRADGDSGIVAQESIFGWVLSGSENASAGCGATLLNLSDVPDDIIRSFWDLETIGVTSKSSNVDAVLDQFENNVQFNTTTGRYKVGLAWKADPPILVDNRRAAMAMLGSLERRLEKKPELKEGYEVALREMETNGHIVEVAQEELRTDNPVFYLPHHPHVRESSVSTKIRPVFNASIQGPNGVSLNDCLESGPNLNPTVMDLLLRFRRWKYAVSADIQKAFLQIELQEKDQEVHRFLWRGESGVRTMKFVRVAFGIKCSPFLLSATVRHHLSLCPPTFVTSELADNMYVDDFLSGADKECEAHQLFVEAKRVMESAGMVLTKWTSNTPNVIGETTGDVGSKSEYTKVLGVMWTPADDRLTYVGVELPESVTYTKRVVLSLIARVFDPLGLVLPFTVTARFLFQDIWRLGLSWDEELPSVLQMAFKKWLAGVDVLKKISIPRQYFTAPWSDCLLDLELHVFGDASLKGYGACLYLRYRSPSGHMESVLVKSCARVAPLERKTLPRLELLGCLVTAQLFSSVMEILRLPSTTKYTCWTDSMVALGWIHGNPSKWKPWVANRVSTIQSLTNLECWRHIAGVENPADLVSRGIPASKLAESEIWWQGPCFLRDMSGRLPVSNVVFPDNSDVDAERRVRDTGEATMLCIPAVPVYELERWSTLNKAYRVIAWTLKFIHNARMSRTSRSLRSADLGKELSPNDYLVAKEVFLKILQRQYFVSEITALERKRTIPRESKLVKLAPFLDEDGLMRVTGRIQLSNLSYESKHPIILPRCHGTMLLIRFIHVHLNHAGTNAMITAMKMDFEVFGLRQLAKNVKRNCVSCKRFDARACNEPAAPLPKVRVTRAPAFSVTGLDFAGPVYSLDFPGKKLYICLFVCGVVRAVHMELVDSLNRDDFVLAFRRFAALKRVPEVVYSDNGKNIVGGQKVIARIFGPAAPEWKFICPRSPWWGGWWERLVRSVKNGIRKTIGKQCLKRSELETLLCEVAASVNSRPLTFVGSDLESKPALTPNHFLTGQGNQSMQNSVIEDPENVTTENLVVREEEMLHRLNDFWRVWSDEYIRNLPAAFQRFRKEGNLNVGSIVLIKEDGLPRMQWAIGKVVKLHEGKDGIPRAVDLTTSRGFRTRAVQKLYDLDIC